MISTPDLEALRLLVAECDGKLVPIGDPRQIGAIGPGGLYGHLTRAAEPDPLDDHPPPAADPRISGSSGSSTNGAARRLLTSCGPTTALIVGDDLPMPRAQLADWHRDFATGADAVMIARRNRDVDYLNDYARELRRDATGRSAAPRSSSASAPSRQAIASRPGSTAKASPTASAGTLSTRTPPPARSTLRRVGGDERVVTLGPAYLDRRRHDDGPSLDYAYALTKFGAQGKTSIAPSRCSTWRPVMSRSLSPLSRGREIENVYAVASSELLDPELGPARRELSDPLHDIRSAIEREGNDYAAAEVALREQIESLSPARARRPPRRPGRRRPRSRPGPQPPRPARPRDRQRRRALGSLPYARARGDRSHGAPPPTSWPASSGPKRRRLARAPPRPGRARGAARTGAAVRAARP